MSWKTKYKLLERVRSTEGNELLEKGMICTIIDIDLTDEDCPYLLRLPVDGERETYWVGSWEIEKSSPIYIGGE